MTAAMTATMASAFDFFPKYLGPFSLCPQALRLALASPSSLPLPSNVGFAKPHIAPSSSFVRVFAAEDGRPGHSPCFFSSSFAAVPKSTHLCALLSGAMCPSSWGDAQRRRTYAKHGPAYEREGEYDGKYARKNPHSLLLIFVLVQIRSTIRLPGFVCSSKYALHARKTVASDFFLGRGNPLLAATPCLSGTGS